MNLVKMAWTVARKDLRSYFRDRTGMMLGFLLPIVLVTAFGFVMKAAFGGSSGMPKVTLGVIDRDHSEASRKLVEAVQASSMLQVKGDAGPTPATDAEAKQMIADGSAHHILLIPEGYGASSTTGKLPDLVLLRDPGRQMEDQVIRGALMQAVMSSSQGNLWQSSLANLGRKNGMQETELLLLNIATKQIQNAFEKTAGSTASSEKAESSDRDQKPKSRMGMDFLEDMLPIRSEDVAPPDRPKGVTHMLAQNVSGISVMMLMFGITACSSMLLVERDSGAMRRLLSLSIPRGSILLGKFFYAGLIGLMQFVVLLIYGEVMFRVGVFRDPLTLAIVSFAWVVTATAFGMAVATWAKTAKQGEGLSTVLILLFAALGGCWFPIQTATMGLGGQLLVKSTPTYWAMSGFQGLLWDQLPWTHPRMLTAVGMQLGIAAGLAVLSVVFFRRRYLAG